MASAPVSPSCRSPTTTLAPCSRKSRAVASPMPAAPPVITATLPSSAPVISIPFAFDWRHSTGARRPDATGERPRNGEPASVRPRQAEHVLAEVREDQVGGDRGDLVEARLAELAFHVVFLGEAEAAVGLQAGVGGGPGGLAGQQLGGVGLLDAGPPLVVQARGFIGHQPGGSG